MAYVKKTFKYMLKAFWALALVCLPAALALGVFTKPMASLSYIGEYASSDIKGFADIFWLIFNKYATKYVYPIVLIFVALVFSSALSLSVIEKHFRVGKLMLRAPLGQINNYFLPVVISYTILALIMALYGIIQTGLVALLHVLLSGWGQPTVFNAVIAAILSLGLFVLSMWAACSAMYWTPIMVIYGFSFRDAAAASIRLLDGNMFGILCGLILPFVIVAVLQNAFCFIPNAVVLIVLAVLLYLFLIMYVMSFIMVSMFGLSKMERRDEKSFRG